MRVAQSSIVHGAVVKSNGPSDRTVHSYLRDSETGLLRDVTESLEAQRPNLDAMLLYAIRSADPPYTLSRGTNGLWANKGRLPDELQRLTKRALEGRVQKLLRDRHLEELPTGDGRHSPVLAVAR